MKSKNQLIAEAVALLAPRRIIDIGYAQSPNEFLANGKVELYGVDLIEAPSPYAKTFVCDLNAETLPFKDGEADVVTMGCTLAHVANPVRLMADIHRVLSTGGTLILSSPNPNYYWENVLNIFFNHFRPRVSASKCEEHFFEFSRYNLRTIAERTGYELVQEIGVTFQLVKTPLKFNPIRFPGMAYEIIYVLKKKGMPESWTHFRGAQGLERLPTKLYR